MANGDHPPACKAYYVPMDIGKYEEYCDCVRPVTQEGESKTVYGITMPEIETLLAVATLYVNAFTEDEMMTLPEKLRFQEVEDILRKHGKRY